ncbi:transposable element Tcb1 transposase [Trichonephila clavipes]|nr:transposable element Tcb1 transposase [Trichonephila clavipes]
MLKKVLENASTNSSAIKLSKRLVDSHVDDMLQPLYLCRVFRSHGLFQCQRVPLQQSGLSARRQLLGLPLTQNHRRLGRQWCERRMWAAEWNEVVFTDESRICLQHHDCQIRVWRHREERMLNSCVMHRHTSLAPSIMVWGGIGYHSLTPLVRIADTLNSQRYICEVLELVVLPYLQALATALFQQDNARPHVARILSKGSLSITRLNCFPGWLTLQIFRR